MRIGIAAITSTALVGGTLVAVPAHPLLPVTAVAQAQEAPFATATGQVIDLALFQDSVDPADQDAFLELLDAIRVQAQFPGTTADSADIDVTLLAGIDLLISGISIPLTDILGIEGAAGVLGANASTPAGNEAFASAGVLNDDGSIDLAANAGASGVQTNLDLTEILAGSGVDAITDQVIDELSLRIGAVSASAERNGDEVTSEYALANVGLNLNSPLVEQLVGDLIREDAANPGLGIRVDNLVAETAGDGSLVSGVTGVLGGILDLLRALSLGAVNVEEPTITLGTDIQGTLEALLGQTLTSTSEVVSINLATGEISIDLEKLGGTSAVDPNTDLLTDAAVDQITAEINTLLTGVLNNVEDAVNDGILDTDVTVSLAADLVGVPIADIGLSGTLNEFLTETATVSVDLFGRDATGIQNALETLLGELGTTIRGAVDGAVLPVLDAVLLDLGGEVVAPLTGGLSELLRDASILRIVLNDQPNPQVAASILRDNPARPNAATGPITNPDDPFTVSALRVTVLGDVIDLPLARATVNADAEWIDGVTPAIDGIADQTVTVGEDIVPITPEATPDDAEITVAGLPAGITYSGGVISGAPTAVGTTEVTVTATTTTGSDSTTFNITATPATVTPTIAPIDDQTIELGEAIENIAPVITPIDAEVDVSGLPDGVIYAGGVISGTPTTAGESDITINATVGAVTATTTFSITVNPDAGIIAPELEDIADQTVTVGEPIADITPEATPDDAVITVDDLPEGVNFTGGVISGAPTAEGTFVVTVSASNAGGTSRTTFTITSNPADSDAPVITPIDDQDGVVGEEIDPIEVEVTPEDAEVEVEGLPDGVEYNPDTGIIEGTPEEGTEGTYSVIVEASNDGGTSTETFIITISDGTTPVVPGENGSANGSTDFLQQCMNSPAAGVASLLVVLGAVGAVAGPALEPMFKAIGGELDRQLRMMVDVTAVDHRMVTNGLFATAAIALASSPILCGMDNSSSGSSESN